MAKQLKDLNIVLGVSGGIAAYKSADLASKLTSAGATVNCILTANACELIKPKTFEAVTGQPVFTEMWSDPAQHSITHISLAEKADLVVLAPATANMIGKIANGICDDLLSTVMCAAWSKPVLVAPAMNNNMWTNPAVQKNIETLRQMQLKIIGPETGRLACGTEGKGRMSEPADIIKQIELITNQL